MSFDDDDDVVYSLPHFFPKPTNKKPKQTNRPGP